MNTITKLTFFTILCLSLFIFGCGGDDDPIVSEDPSFKFDITWDEDFQNLDGIVGMDLPTEFDITWE